MKKFNNNILVRNLKLAFLTAILGTFTIGKVSAQQDQQMIMHWEKKKQH